MSQTAQLDIEIKKLTPMWSPVGANFWKKAK